MIENIFSKIDTFIKNINIKLFSNNKKNNNNTTNSNNKMNNTKVNEVNIVNNNNNIQKQEINNNTTTIINNYSGEFASPLEINEEDRLFFIEIDSFFSTNNIKYKVENKKPSEIIQGFLYNIRVKKITENNLDAIAQSAHSLREILYPFIKPDMYNVNVYITKSLKDIFYKLNNITHHNTESTTDGLEKLFVELKNNFSEIKQQQILNLKEIDKYINDLNI